jgi:hypothetical protein
MIILASDNHALVKAGFTIRDSVQQGFGQSTPHHVSHPRGFSPPEKAFSPRTIHCILMGHDNICQGDLYLRLTASIRRMVQVLG